MITYHINIKRNLTRDCDNLIPPLHKRILFVATPNSLAVASLEILQCTQQRSAWTRHRSCVSSSLHLYHVVFAVWAGLRYVGVRNRLLFNIGLSLTILPDTPRLLNETGLLFGPGLYSDKYGMWHTYGNQRGSSLGYHTCIYMIALVTVHVHVYVRDLEETFP